MLIRIEKNLIMILPLLYVSQILQAGHQNYNDNQVPRAKFEKYISSNDRIGQRVAFLSAQAHDLAERLLSSPSINEQKRITPVPVDPMSLLALPSINEEKKTTPVSAERINLEKTWCTQSGKTLKSSLIAWGKISGWSIKWQSEYDYPVLSEVCFKGSFEKAMEAVITVYQEAEYPLYLDIYPHQQLTVISH